MCLIVNSLLMRLIYFGLLVGGSPTASHFFCFAKKSNQKKATRYELPT